MDRANKLTKLGDPLVALNHNINWEAFRSDLNILRQKDRKSSAGAKAFDVILMFKILALQQLNNLSDDRIEYQIQDRVSFMRFLGLGFADKILDAKTVWLFREHLKEAKLIEVLFDRFHSQLAACGYIAKAGQMIDATFVEVPRQRKNREENAQIKAGETPTEWKKEENYLLSTSKAKFVKRDQKIIHSQQNKNSPTPENQKLGQELNTSSEPKPTWEVTSPEQ